MDVNSQFEHNLLTNLRQTQDNLSRLLQCLTQEQTALRHRDIATLQSATPEKANLLGQMESDQQNRASLLRQMGIAQNHSALTNYIETRAKQPDPLRALWINVQSLIQEVRDKNLINGSVMTANQHPNSRLFNALQSPPANHASYNTDGKFGK